LSDQNSAMRTMAALSAVARSGFGLASAGMAASFHMMDIHHI